MKVRVWAVNVAALILWCGPADAQGPGVIDVQGLGGEWLGTIQDKATGKCAMDEEPADFIIKLRITKDGALRARTARGKDFQREDEPWEGSVSAAGDVQVATTQHSICNDRPRQYELKLTGKITQEGDTNVLTLEGHDDACPDMGCSSTRTYVLRKRVRQGDGRLTMQ